MITFEAKALQLLQEFLQRRLCLVAEQLFKLWFEQLQGDHFDHRPAIKRMESFAILISAESGGFPIVSD